MPYGTTALLSQPLFSEYRGPRILNDASAPPPSDPPEDPQADPPKDPPKDPAKDPNDDFKGRLDALDAKNKEYKAKIKEFEDAEKKRIEDEAKAKGEHEQLATQYATERDSEKTARETAESKLALYEEMTQKQIESSLKGISDEEKRKAAESMLDGLAIEEQAKRLPEIMKLVGSEATGFGGATPTGTTPGKQPKDVQNARFEELLSKERKEPLTPEESREKRKLMTELSKVLKPE